MQGLLSDMTSISGSNAIKAKQMASKASQLDDMAFKNTLAILLQTCKSQSKSESFLGNSVSSYDAARYFLEKVMIWISNQMV